MLQLLLQHGDFLNIDISQGSLATQLKCAGIFKYEFVAHLPACLPVKEFWKKPVNIWGSYGKIYCVIYYNFGHTVVLYPVDTSRYLGVARLDDDTPANVALQLHINVSLSRPPDRTWRRPPGRPRNMWLDQLRNDSTRPTGELWRRAVDRGHGGATTRRPSPATRPWFLC